MNPAVPIMLMILLQHMLKISALLANSRKTGDFIVSELKNVCALHKSMVSAAKFSGAGGVDFVLLLNV